MSEWSAAEKLNLLLDLILNDLGWTKEFVLSGVEKQITFEDEAFVTCPYDPSHRMEESCLLHHKEKCPSRPLEVPRDLLYDGAPAVVYLDAVPIPPSNPPVHPAFAPLPPPSSSSSSSLVAPVPIPLFPPPPYTASMQQHWIQTWTKIPTLIVTSNLINEHTLDRDHLLFWLRNNLPRYAGDLFRDEEDFVWVSQLLEKKNHPDKFSETLTTLLSSKQTADALTLAVWKAVLSRLAELNRLPPLPPTPQPLHYPPPMGFASGEIPTRGNERKLERYKSEKEFAEKIRQERREMKMIREPTEDFLKSGKKTSTSTSEGDGVKSRLEIMAERRDYKRRRQKYRARNVHLTKRTPTQVLRDYIQNRMEDLDAIFGKGGEEKEGQEEKQEVQRGRDGKEERSRNGKREERDVTRHNLKREREAEEGWKDERRKEEQRHPGRRKRRRSDSRDRSKSTEREKRHHHHRESSRSSHDRHSSRSSHHRHSRHESRYKR